MLNYCVVSGYVLDEPKIRFVGEDNSPFADFSISLWIMQTKVGWIKVFCGDQLTTAAVKYLRRGTRVVVTGYLTRTYGRRRDGRKKWEVELAAISLEILAG